MHIDGIEAKRPIVGPVNSVWLTPLNYSSCQLHSYLMKLELSIVFIYIHLLIKKNCKLHPTFVLKKSDVSWTTSNGISLKDVTVMATLVMKRSNIRLNTVCF